MIRNCAHKVLPYLPAWMETVLQIPVKITEKKVVRYRGLIQKMQNYNNNEISENL